MLQKFVTITFIIARHNNLEPYDYLLMIQGKPDMIPTAGPNLTGPAVVLQVSDY